MCMGGCVKWEFRVFDHQVQTCVFTMDDLLCLLCCFYLHTNFFTADIIFKNLILPPFSLDLETL